MPNKQCKQRYMANGLCANCGARPAIDGIIHCEKCVDRHKTYSKRIRADRLAAGLCYKCGNQRHGLSTKCKQCLNIDAIRTRNKRIELKIDAINAYGGPACACCGENNIGFLTLDHINGGGNTHRREIGDHKSRGNLIYGWLKRNNYPPGFQVLCFNCNCGKNSNYGVCPHKGEVKRFTNDLLPSDPATIAKPTLKDVA